VIFGKFVTLNLKNEVRMGVVLTIFFVFLAIMVLVFVLVFRRRVSSIKNSEWTGEVLEKSETENEDDKFHPYYSLKVKTDDGRVRYVDVNYELYNKVKPGINLKKEKGALLPKII